MGSQYALRQRVSLDGQDPFGRYAPFLKWRQQLKDEPAPENWDGLLTIYKHWRNRFPDRAEGYILTALVWAEGKGSLAQAKAILKTGMDRDATPRQILQSSLIQLSSAAARDR